MLTLAVITLVAAAAFAFGWPTRNGKFLSGDDQRFVVEQVFVNHPSLKHAARLLTMVHGDLYQPLPMLSFQADYALASPDPAARFGISPYVFHLTNILLHVVNALLACLVSLRVARCRRVAVLAGLMFACHPLAVEPVAWISGRMILLATTFSLLLIFICLSRRADGRGAWPWLGGVSWVFSLLSKVLPSVPVAAAWCDYHTRRRLPRRCWITYTILLAVGGAATWLAISSTGRFGMIESTEAESTTSAPVRILLASRYYLENYVWPSRMAAWSPPPHSVALLSADTGIALAEWALFGVLAWIAWRRSRSGFIGLGLFVILIAPFLGATVARRLLTADRYMYLPMIGLHIAVAAGFVQAVDRLGRRLRPSVATGALAASLLGVLIAGLTLGWAYADCWKDTAARDRRVVAIYPDRVEAHVELAKAHIFQNEPDAALETIARARKRWPENARLASEAGEAYRLKHNWSKAAAEFAYALQRLPNRSRTLYYYALTLEQLGKVDDARERYKRILERDDRFLPAVAALARSYRSTGERAAAMHMFERVIEINPFHRDALFELALMHIQAQDWRRAEPLLRAIVELDPHDAPALLNLGVAITHQGYVDEAIAIYDRLLASDPSAVAARVNRAGLLVSIGRAAEAEGEYRDILASQPANRSAAIGLHELLQQQRRFDELIKLWSDFPSTGDDLFEPRAWLAWAHVLAQDREAAGKIVATIPPASPERAFARWALAYDALRRGDFQALSDYLGEAQAPTVVPPTQREQARVVLAALSALPQDARHSPAGLYALARALLFDGSVSAARAAAVQVLAMADAGMWADAAGQLVDLLDNDEDKDEG
ncbi:MAG: tetratricopeptide repeat protein [Phycisphaerae bacterium]|nr:tetratricopeptide repeat protein [Phycisphaerae bacterium]